MGKKAVIVIGNVCSGKSMYCVEYIRKHPEYVHISLDLVRKSLAMWERLESSFSFERACERECMDRLLAHDLVLFESVGTSWFYDRAVRWLKSKRYDIRVIKMIAPVQVCVERYQSRVRSTPQMPAMYKLSYRELIRENHAKIESVYCDENILVKT